MERVAMTAQAMRVNLIVQFVSQVAPPSPALRRRLADLAGRVSALYRDRG